MAGTPPPRKGRWLMDGGFLPELGGFEKQNVCLHNLHSSRLKARGQERVGTGEPVAHAISRGYCGSVSCC